MSDPLMEPGLDPVIQFFVLCDYAAMMDRGKLILVGQFQSITVRALPASHPRFFIVFGWRGQPREHTYRVVISPPSDDSAVCFQTDEIRVPKESAAWGNTIIEVLHLPFHQVGTYWVHIICDGWKVADHPLAIVYTPEA